MILDLTNYEDREYLIISVSEIHLVDFNEVLETSPETLRKSLDGTKTIIKWDGNMPDFVNNLTIKEGPYTFDEINAIVETSEWTEPFVMN
jgi:hypothetical protein